MSESRKTYTSQFKAKVGLEAIRGEKTVNDIGQEYRVHPIQVGLWKKEIQTRAETLFETKRGRKKQNGASDPERLYGEIGRLKMELDWLKKKFGLSL
jgi:transposase-like protein